MTLAGAALLAGALIGWALRGTTCREVGRPLHLPAEYHPEPPRIVVQPYVPPTPIYDWKKDDTPWT